MSNILEGKINKEEFENDSIHPANIRYYLEGIEEKYNKESISDLINEIANQCVLPCVLYQIAMDSNKPPGKELLKNAIESIKMVNKELKKIKERS